MDPQATVPQAVPQWATDDVVDFMLQAKEAAWWTPENTAPVQVNLNPQPETAPIPDQKAIDQAAIDEKLKQEIESQKKFDEEADRLMQEIESNKKVEPAKEDKVIVEDKKPEDDKTPIKEAMWKIAQLSIEEQEQFITYVDDLQKSHAELSANKIKDNQTISDLQYENSLLKDSSKTYIEKSNSLENDQIRNKIPEWIWELVTSFKDFDSKKDDFTRKSFRKELIRIVEKEFKRSLNDYLGDVYIGSNDVISWQESFGIDLPSPSVTAKKQSEKSKLDYMSDLF